MFRRRYHRRSSFLPFVIFRLFLSLIIFAFLLGGAYYAYREFSGYDPIKLNPKSLGLLLLSNSSKDKILDQITGLLNTDFGKQTQKVIPRGRLNQSGQVGGIQNIDKPNPPKKLSFKFALVADSHSENDLLTKALSQANEQKVAFIIGLGDYTEVGTISELEAAKAAFTGSGLRFFVTPGDHDLWDSRDKGRASPLFNFNQVFGPSFQSFSQNGVKFIILDNSDNYVGLSDAELKWLNNELEKSKKENPKLILVFLHEPPYHPSSERVMGKVSPNLKDQAKQVLKRIKQTGVKGVFAGDIHFFTRYNDPETGLDMTTIGAIASQRNTQNPRYAIISIYDDGSYDVEDIEVK